jgi:hypothetical protein
MSIDNPVFKQLVAAISPVISIGVGSAIVMVCSQQGLKPMYLEQTDLPALKPAIIDHYQKFWSSKIDQIQERLNQL